jgi:hypothetical protein
VAGLIAINSTIGRLAGWLEAHLLLNFLPILTWPTSPLQGVLFLSRGIMIFIKLIASALGSTTR